MIIKEICEHRTTKKKCPYYPLTHLCNELCEHYKPRIFNLDPTHPQIQKFERRYGNWRARFR